MGRTGIVNGVGAVFMDRRLLPKPARAGGYHPVAILRKKCRPGNWPTPLAGAVLAFGLLAAACGASSERPVSTRSPPTFGAWEYEVRPTPALSELQVRVCFDGRPPSSLIATKRNAAGAMVRAWRVAGPGQPLAVGGRVLSLASVGPNECVAYVVDIERAIGSSWSGGFARSEAVVLDAATWLWRPSSWPEGSTATVRFVLPVGQQLATSWAEVGPLTFRFPPEAFGYLSHIAIGRFSELTVELPTTEVRLVRLPGRLDLSDEQLGEWVEFAAGLVTRLSGRFPVSNPLVLLVPVPPGRSPVAFGAVGRGGGASVLFLVRENATLEALNSDWVAPHEFSHLAFPFVRRPERFFSEGLATYFQEVLRAWGGVLTELEGWQHLNAGFRAGMRSGTGRTLREESRAVFRTYAFRRIYWCGAALALWFDIELHKRNSSLASALAALPPSARVGSWAAEALAERLDEVVGQAVFQPLLDRYLDSTEFPDLESAYAFLGVVRDASGRVVRLDDEAPGAEIRRRIMAARPSIAATSER